MDLAQLRDLALAAGPESQGGGFKVQGLMVKRAWDSRLL